MSSMSNTLHVIYVLLIIFVTGCVLLSMTRGIRLCTCITLSPVVVGAFHLSILNQFLVNSLSTNSQLLIYYID